jgi:CheY-like chemotaxis protein
MRIFIADDDPDDLELFQSAVKEVEPTAEIIAAYDGLCLLENLVIKTPPLPDIVFLDINMPKMNGYECLKKIRQQPLLKDLPVVVSFYRDFKEGY